VSLGLIHGFSDLDILGRNPGEIRNRDLLVMHPLRLGGAVIRVI
jgi:hypothetical protein